MTFPSDAMAFYRDLEENNSREWWHANKRRYDHGVRGPLTEAMALLADEFGEAKIFRPYRDVRFAADKAPFKTHQGAFVATAPACGYYVEINGYEVHAGGGFYRATPDALKRVRAGVADDTAGALLESMVDSLRDQAWLIQGDHVRTAPRGYNRTHPRIRLLRYRSLSAITEIKAEGVDALAREVAEAWRTVAPTVDWLTARLRD